MNTNNPKVGLDATVITNISIRKIDYKKISAISYRGIPNHIKISYSKTTSCVLQDLYSIKIIDNLVFGDLTIYRSYYKKSYTQNVEEKIGTRMAINAGHILIDNRNNVSVRSYKDYINLVVCPYLKFRYDIDADFSTAEFESLEININIPIRYAFSDYRRVLSLLETLLPGRGYNLSTKKKTAPNIKSTQSYGKFNNTEVFIIYDKGDDIRKKYNTAQKKKKIYQQLINKLNLLPDSIYTDYLRTELEKFSQGYYDTCTENMRIELRMYDRGKDHSRNVSQHKISTFFGLGNNALLSAIDDKLLQERYTRIILKKIFYPFCQWYTANKIIMRKKAIYYKKTYGYAWQQYFFPALFETEIANETLVVLDFQHLRDILYFDDPRSNIRFKHNITQTMQGFRNKEKPYSNRWCGLSSNDSQKLVELFSQLGIDYEKTFTELNIGLLMK